MIITVNLHYQANPRGKIYWITYRWQGRQYFMSSESSDIDIAKEVLRREKKDLDAGRKPLRVSETPTVDELLDFIHYANRAPSYPKTLSIVAEGLITGLRKKVAGLLPFPIYQCRHTFATRLAAAGVSDTIIDQLLGHSRRDVLRFYTARVPEYLRDAINLLDKLRSAKTEMAGRSNNKVVEGRTEDGSTIIN